MQQTQSTQGEAEPYLNAALILEELNRRIAAQVPECKAVYIDLCPQDFERPSVLLQLTQSTTKPVSATTYERTDKFLIVCCDEVGEHYEAQTLRLLEMRERVLAIFLPGYLRVGGRALSVSAKAIARDYDKAPLEVTATYREDLPRPEPQPPMRDMILSLKGE